MTIKTHKHTRPVLTQSQMADQANKIWENMSHHLWQNNLPPDNIAVQQKNYPASGKMTLQCFSEHVPELSKVL